MARNGDGLFRRSGIWYFKYKNHDGIYREKSTAKRKQSDAREYKHAFLEKLRSNQLPTAEAKWKLGQALDKWIAYRTLTRPKPSVAAERTAAKHRSEVIGADLKLCGVTAWDLR